MSFTKLHESLVHSTIWREPNHIRVVWVTMMAIADKHGEIQASVPGLADLARVSIQECEEALSCFMSPDPYSRSKDFDGRRIEEIEGGWALLNHPKYRMLASKDDQKERTAERNRKLRERKKTVTRDAPLRSVTILRDIADADTEANTEREREETRSLAPVVSSGRKFPDHAAICARINALRPEWGKPAQWTGKELHALHDALGQLDELTEDDWIGLKRYFAARLEQGAGFWQPKSRGQFVENIADVFANYSRWTEKRRPATTTPKPPPKVEQQPLTEEDQKALDEFIKFGKI